jgi:hypothetical protein
MSETLIVDSIPVDGVKVLALNRPAKRNALSQALIVDLLDKLRDASQDNSVRAVIITGSTTFFCGMHCPGLLYPQSRPPLILAHSSAISRRNELAE